MSFKLKLSGRSGCEIELMERSGNMVVHKSSKSIAYNPRLMLQAAKQKKFQTLSTDTGFRAPHILETFAGDSHTLAWMEMEYVHAEKYSDYLERISAPELQKLANTFETYFINSLKRGARQRPLSNIVENKRLDLAAQLRGKPHFNQILLEEVLRYLQVMPMGNLVSGYCHGDFTFSNIMFDDQTCYLIDFLDTFLESPIQDIVKFRQDTYYGWSIMLEQGMPQHAANKLKQVMGYLDQMSISVIHQYPDVEAWYTYLQVFNLLRILPYVEAKLEIAFVESALEKTI